MDGILFRQIIGNISTCGKQPGLIIFSLMICLEIALELHLNLDVSFVPAWYQPLSPDILILQLATLEQSSQQFQGQNPMHPTLALCYRCLG